ncbi:MAG: type I 3-dehydroquinate dehydratase [Spirochaetes bacterium]|jgi:3-dehydroquinate dehydratase type I|nr:type I 3-dehydroquinate dehydratase [Spirochaetota bacterium]
MICVSIADVSIEEACNIASRAEICEIRLDRLNFEESHLPELFGCGNTVATFRPCKKADDELRMKTLARAIECGATYVDVEVENSDSFKKYIKDCASTHKCKTIVSYHDYEKTPFMRELELLINWCFDSGADIAKIACFNSSYCDAARILSLYSFDRPIISIGMGEAGKITRVAAILLGAPFTYASIDEGKGTAPGQIDSVTLTKIIDLIRGSNGK